MCRGRLSAQWHKFTRASPLSSRDLATGHQTYKLPRLRRQPLDIPSQAVQPVPGACRGILQRGSTARSSKDQWISLLKCDEYFNAEDGLHHRHSQEVKSSKCISSYLDAPIRLIQTHGSFWCFTLENSSTGQPVEPGLLLKHGCGLARPTCTSILHSFQNRNAWIKDPILFQYYPIFDPIDPILFQCDPIQTGFS